MPEPDECYECGEEDQVCSRCGNCQDCCACTDTFDADELGLDPETDIER